MRVARAIARTVVARNNTYIVGFTTLTNSFAQFRENRSV